MAKTKATKADRVYFTDRDDRLPIPNLTQHQIDSWHELIKTGLGEIFEEVNPINDYTEQKLSLKFKGYRFDEPKLTYQEAIENNTTFEAPMMATVELTNKITGEIEESEVYMGNYPWMTDHATFVINGTERVVVSQLIRSAGVFFSATEINSRKYFGAKVIPGRGAWLEFETANNGAIYVKIDRRRKLPITTFLRAMNHISNKEIKELFKDVDTGEINYIDATLEKDPAQTPSEALIETFRRLRPGDLATVDNARGMIEKMFYDFKRYDYSRVGRYKINKRLDLDVPNTQKYRTFQMNDFIEIVREIIRLNNEQGEPDDIDSLSNRRVKLVGELVARHFRVGVLRMQRNIMDRMTIVDASTVTPAQLINARPVTASVREFFASSQLSQLMDQANPLSELAHKRTLSSMGPGGLTRERAGFEVRDAHPTHYGRVCAVETPEGGNIGLVLKLATYARINEYGFIETPYLKVKNGKVTDEVVYLDADQEKAEIIADAGEKLNDKKQFVDTRVSARKNLQPVEVDASEVTLMDAAYSQILGSTAGLVPFIEKTRVDRALTGSNMQRQAVPLVKPEAPLVGTGLEKDVARNSSQLILAEDSGVVTRAEADILVVKYNKLGEKTYTPVHFKKTNEDRCFDQRVMVDRGDKVKKGDVLIEGASVADGEIALGKNFLIAFMPWHGFNMDDAVVISRRLVEDDDLTSINIKDYIVEVRETKLGAEIVTRDIPNVSEESLRHLDEDGIVQIGSEVQAGDVLVGKITPKGEQELSSEERLLRAIFGEKAKDVRDTSKRMDNAGGGKVIGVKVFRREDGYDLKAGVLMQIQIFVAQIRKVQVGDKMAGRYGNKGVIARVLPVEDMPFTADGTPIDIVLNPLGVPSRMNLGQLFELPLGLAANSLGYKAATVPYHGASEEAITGELEKAGFDKSGKMQLFDGQTGEPFEEPVTVGMMYMMKLHHMVADKIHARSTGPYTMVTQQPLGGKAQNGGQRFGEMEVWALEAYGAATTLQEMLTIKSDDVFGRAKAYESIIKNEPIVGPKVPESFNVLVKELQGLGLRVDLINTDENEVVDANEAKESRGDSAKAPDEDMEMPPDEIEEFNEDNLPGMQIEDIAVEISAAEEEEE
ncbi:MAG: DNA-directed RNA polymerase subunit beta [Candidatus Nanosyncoccaceae bacterium]